MNIYDKLKEHLSKICQNKDENIKVRATALSQEEAIGRPEDNDYPLAKGRERIMEATYQGAKGHAFTDQFAHWQGTIDDILQLPMEDNFHRALLVATINAAMCANGELEDTVHCKDDGPIQCASKLKEFFEAEKLSPPTVLIGYQPRLAEILATLGELHIVDLDEDNQGQKKAGTVILSPRDSKEMLQRARTLFITGSTIVNGTIEEFLDKDVDTIFFGVTIAGPAKVLGLRRYCKAGLPGR